MNTWKNRCRYLQKRMNDPDAEIRAKAAAGLALFHRGPQSEKEVAELIDRLKHNDPDVRYQAAFNLNLMMPAAMAAAPALTRHSKILTQVCDVKPPSPWGRFLDWKARQWFRYSWKC